MLIVPIAFSLSLLLAGGPAKAQGEAFLSVCGDPGVSAREAVRTCSRALQTDDISDRQKLAAALNLGGAHFELGQPRQALDAYERALDYFPNDPRALAGRADARAALGDLPGAAVDWNRAVRAAPSDPMMRAGRGAFRLRAGDPHGALEDVEAALSRDRDDPALRFNRGVALALLGEEAAAEAVFAGLVRDRPQDAGAWLNLGRMRAKSRPQAALDAFARAAAIAPEWPQPYLERAALSETLGRREAANEDWRRAWELGHRSEALTEKILAIGP